MDRRTPRSVGERSAPVEDATEAQKRAERLAPVKSQDIAAARRGLAPAANRSSDDEEELEGREQRPGPRRHDGEN